MKTPAGPIWSDFTTGASVYVNGAMVEINLADGWSGRLTAAEATQLAADLTAAVAEASAWAARWNSETRTYDEVPA